VQFKTVTSKLSKRVRETPHFVYEIVVKIFSFACGKEGGWHRRIEKHLHRDSCARVVVLQREGGGLRCGEEGVERQA
jgi:hypothetical protein